MKIHVIVTVIACSLLYGCATAPRFSEAEFPRSDADVEVLAVHQEIGAEASQTSAGGAGLIGLLVASSVNNVRNDRAEEAIAPLRDYLIEYDLSDEFARRIRESEAIERFVVGGEATVRSSFLPPEERSLKRPLINIEPRVLLSNDMRNLFVDVYVVEAVPVEGKNSARRGVHQSYRFVWPLEGGDGLDREEAVAAWMERPEDELVAIIELGMEQTTSMLNEHLRQKTLVFEDDQTRLEVPSQGRYHVWQEREEVTWLAHTNGVGKIYSVPNHAIE